MIPSDLPLTLHSASSRVEEVISRINLDVNEAQDNLIAAKAFQVHYANKSHGPEVVYGVGDRVMLSTFHQHREYRKKGDKRAAKFFPRWDGPYTVINSNPHSSTYTLDMDGTRYNPSSTLGGGVEAGNFWFSGWVLAQKMTNG